MIPHAKLRILLAVFFPASLVFAGFRDVTVQAKLNVLLTCGTIQKRFIVEGTGSGCAWFDYNNDGWQDLYIVNGLSLENLRKREKNWRRAPNYLFRNNGDGSFRDVTLEAGVMGAGLGNGVWAADYDNDGLVDLFVTNYGDNLLYKNNGDGTFTDVAAKTGVAGGWTWHTGATFGDYDNDGHLDLYVAGYLNFDIENPPLKGKFCTYRGITMMCGPEGLEPSSDVLYHNNGDGTFTDVTSAAGVRPLEQGYGFSALFQDLENDGDQDIFVTNDSGPNFLYENQGNGKFVENALLWGLAYSRDGRAQDDMGLAVGDVDNDGLLDLLTTTFSEDYYPLFENGGAGNFEEISYASGIGKPTLPFLGWGTFFFDYDNNGTLDLFAASGHLYPKVDQFPDQNYKQRNLLFSGNGALKFREVSKEVGFDEASRQCSRGAAYCDYDNDGDLDILVINLDDTPTLLRNDASSRNNWINLKLRGTKSNRDAIGARIKLVTGDQVQYREVVCGGNYLSQNDSRAHFGLSGGKVIDRIEVHWPSGATSDLTEIKANQFLIITENQQQREGVERKLSR